MCIRDRDLIVPEKSISILDGAIQASGWGNIRADGISRMYFDALAKKYHFSLSTPWEDLTEEVRDIVLYGTKGEKLELHYDQPRGKGVLLSLIHIYLRPARRVRAHDAAGLLSG